jgi:hypothetical protein
MFQIKLTIGDWSHDGHNQTATFFLSSTLDIKELASTFKKGVKVLGFDITESCKRYNDTSLSEDKVELLRKTGFELRDPDRVEPDEYLFIYLHTVLLANEEFRFEILTFPNINIGGYGLFHAY